MKPAPWKNAQAKDLEGIRAVAFDIDDTFSSHGKITAEAFSALWALKDAGFLLVPVTGRPAGWCDHIARFWPVDAVVGENGAFSLFMKDGKLSRVETPRADGISAADARRRLEALKTEIFKAFPHAKWASDQGYRECDLAIDFCEDVAPWPQAEIDRLVFLCQSRGAQAKISSIHVNAWFGQYDKKAGFQALVKSGVLGKKAPANLKAWMYLGDSPNDEPMFAHFPNSVGVANLKDFLPRLNHTPRWLASKPAGQGFAEVAKRLGAKRSIRARRSR